MQRSFLDKLLPCNELKIYYREIRISTKHVDRMDSASNSLAASHGGIINHHQLRWTTRSYNLRNKLIFCLFNLILYVPSTIFQLNRDRSSWVEPILSYDKCVLLKDHNSVTPLRLGPAALWSQVKHSTTEPLRLGFCGLYRFFAQTLAAGCPPAAGPKQFFFYSVAQLYSAGLITKL